MRSKQKPAGRQSAAVILVSGGIITVPVRTPTVCRIVTIADATTFAFLDAAAGDAASREESRSHDAYLRSERLGSTADALGGSAGSSACHMRMSVFNVSCLSASGTRCAVDGTVWETTDGARVDGALTAGHARD
jgi:hypothetical protein